MGIWQYIGQGGPIMYILLVVNFFGVSLVIWKLLKFHGENSHLHSNARDIVSSIHDKKLSTDKEGLILEIAKDKSYAFISSLEAGLSTIKTIATVSPLLGLLGTVIGVLSAFQSISVNGMQNPSVFAGGISMALITTVGGLVVAIPHFICFNYLTGWLNSYEVKLEDKVLDLYMNAENK